MAPYRLTRTQLIEIPQLWKKLADQYGGKSKQIHSKAPSAIAGAFNESRRFELRIPTNTSRNISITAGEQHHLKVNYRFPSNLNLQLRIFTEDLMAKVNKIFGGQDIRIGESQFDSKYIIRSNNQRSVENLLGKDIMDDFFNLHIYEFEVTSEAHTELFIMPLIREENEIKMKQLIDFTINSIKALSVK